MDKQLLVISVILVIMVTLLVFTLDGDTIVKIDIIILFILSKTGEHLSNKNVRLQREIITMQNEVIETMVSQK